MVMMMFSVDCQEVVLAQRILDKDKIEEDDEEDRDLSFNSLAIALRQDEAEEKRNKKKREGGHGQPTHDDGYIREKQQKKKSINRDIMS
eukprot:scaffold51_cov172-Ochromonas_danica.AAC.3